MSMIPFLKSVTTNSKIPQTWSSVRLLSCSYVHTIRTRQRLPLHTAFRGESGEGKICRALISSSTRPRIPPYSGVFKYNRVLSSSLHYSCLIENCERAAMASPTKSLETLNFVNTALKSLPIDENEENYVRSVPGRIYI